MDTERSNPNQAQKFIKDLTSNSQTPKGAQLTIRPLVKADIRKAEIGLLRIAYLYAFSELGYGLMLNNGLIKVREQLLNPDQKILPDVLWIKYEFPDDMYGFNIIREPKELRCYLIIFDLVTSTQIMQCAIALPGPSAPGIEIYKNIENLLCQDKIGDIKTTIEHIDTEGYLHEKKYTFASNIWWQEYCK